MKKDIAIRQQEKNEKKKLLIELNKSLLDAVTISLHSYDMQAFYIALLEGSRRRNDAYKHVLLLMKLQRKKNKNIKNHNFTSTRHLPNPDKKGFQNLFFNYFTEFRPFSQRKKILSAILNFVRDGPILGPQLNASKLLKKLMLYCIEEMFVVYIKSMCFHLSSFVPPIYYYYLFISSCFSLYYCFPLFLSFYLLIFNSVPSLKIVIVISIYSFSQLQL